MKITSYTLKYSNIAGSHGPDFPKDIYLATTDAGHSLEIEIAAGSMNVPGALQSELDVKYSNPIITLDAPDALNINSNLGSLFKLTITEAANLGTVIATKT